MGLEEKIKNLKQKKARQFSEIESLSKVNDIALTQFGKTVFDLMKSEKQLLQENKNTFDEN